MSQATATPPTPIDYDSPEMRKKRNSTVGWVVGLAFVGLIFDGYDLVVYGAVLPRFMLGDETTGVLGRAMAAPEAGVVGSYAMIGVMIGALIAGTIGDIVGRRIVMLGALAWFSIGMLLSALAQTVAMFSIFRFFTGLGVGALVGITGAIVAEFAPPGKKNLATAFVYTGVPMGSLISALVAINVLPAINAPIPDQRTAFQILFVIGALPLVTVLPLAIWKMPESIAWLASRGKMDKAIALSQKTGVPVPEAPPVRAGSKASDSRSGWAGLFGSYFFAAILIGLISASCLLLVYTLNTWLPRIMQGVVGPTVSLALLLVLNGGAMAGTLFGSRFADKYSPQRIVAIGFVVGVISIGAIGLLVSDIQIPTAAEQRAGAVAQGVPGLIIALLWITIVLVGIGTSGVQSLIYAMAANYYRTNVRAAGVAWTGGFGRLGGVLGPIIGGILAATFAANIENIFYVLAAIALLATVLTLILPKPKAEATAEPIVPTIEATPTDALPVREDRSRLYDTIMVVVDETGNKLTRDRVSEFVSLTGQQVHLVYLAPERLITGEVPDNDVAIDPKHVANLQAYVNQVSHTGVPTTGQVLTATLFGRGDTVVDLARQLRTDLIILNTEEGGQRAKAALAEDVAKSNPKMAVLIARSTQ